MNKLSFSLLIILSVLLMSCKTSKDASQLSTIPFEKAKGYFFKNNADLSGITNNKISTQEDFNKLFGSATLMGPTGKPTVIDFSKQYVIPVVKDEVDYPAELTPISLSKENDSLILKYRYKVQDQKKTFTSRPTFLIIVDKKYDGSVVLVEE